jgi:hypothetical protein
MHYSLLYSLACLVETTAVRNCTGPFTSSSIKQLPTTANYRASHELICGHEGDADGDVIQHRDAAGVMSCADAYAIGFTLRRETET